MSLNDFVVDALVHTPSYQNARLWTVENHEKYSTLLQPDSGPDGEHHFNHEIFLLMRALNEQGIGEEGLCADTRGHGALKSVIANVAERLAALASGRRVHYVELGPEPIKSTCLLKRMAETSTIWTSPSSFNSSRRIGTTSRHPQRFSLEEIRLKSS